MGMFLEFRKVDLSKLTSKGSDHEDKVFSWNFSAQIKFQSKLSLKNWKLHGINPVYVIGPF